MNKQANGLLTMENKLAVTAGVVGGGICWGLKSTVTMMSTERCTELLKHYIVERH